MKKVLIVEDSDDMRVLYRRLFRREQNISFSEAVDAEVAIHMVANEKPDLMIIDISLPGMDGLRLTEKIRKEYPNVKILIITGHEVSRYFDDAKRVGADDVLTKDLDKDLIRKCKVFLGLQ
jgi:two-component system response regulator YesN